MRRRTALALVSLLALLLVSALAAQQDGDRARKRKKHVRATLIDVAPTVTPQPTAGEPRSPEPTPAAATATGARSDETTTTQPATATDGAAPDSAAPSSATSSSPPAQAPASASAAPSAGDTPSTGAAPAAATATQGTSPALDPPRNDTDRPGSLQERIEVTEVQIDAVVKDNGKQVTGLGPEDFVVTEEGRPVEITSVRFYGSPEELESTGEGEVERADRYFILFFHDRSRDATFVRPLLLDAGQQARRWVEEQRLPNDQVAVMSWDVRLRVYSDFTRDPGQIVEAISRAVTSRKEPERESGRTREPLRSGGDSPSLLANLPPPPELARETRVFEKALALVGRAADGIVGRKNLMLFSIGFGDVDPSGIWTRDARYYPPLEKSLNDGNVAVYAIDLLGHRRGAPAGLGIASSLAAISSDTNGLYYETFINFQTPMKEVAKDTAGYYLLSYRSEYPRGTTGYREVKVDTVEKKYEVRARKGYAYGVEGVPITIPDEERGRSR